MSARPFFETLRELRRGQTLLELGDRLAELTQAVVTTGKPGKLKLELSLAPADKGGALIMTDKVTVIEPSPDVSRTIFFATADFQLSRSDPNQMQLGLRSVNTTQVPPGVDPTTGEIISN